jgi:hypothetical protein
MSKHPSQYPSNHERSQIIAALLSKSTFLNKSECEEDNVY